MLLTIVLLILGLILIIKGGDVFVDAASWLAEKTGIPKLIIGATVVSLATTLPELFVSFIAASNGKVDMAVGNAVGSVTVNIGLIMGIALICMPAVVKRKDYLLKSILMLAAAAILVIFGLTGSIGVLPSVLLMIIFITAMWDNVHGARVAMKQQAAVAAEIAATSSAEISAMSASGAVSGSAGGGAVVQEKELTVSNSSRETIINVMKFILGAAATVLGSQLLVDNGSELATLLGVPERIIAVSVVAVGTSLPELVTTLTAIAKKQNSLSVGNVLGANIIDLTLILPGSALIGGSALPVSQQFARVDIPACLIVGIIALVPMLLTKKFHRLQGIVMVTFYVAYLILAMFVLQ